MSSRPLGARGSSEAKAGWAPVRAAALDADAPVDMDRLREQSDDVIPDTEAVLTQGQLIGLFQEHSRSRGHRSSRPLAGHPGTC